jgi:hypothetical protein
LAWTRIHGPGVSWDGNSTSVLTLFQSLTASPFKSCVFLKKSGAKTPAQSTQVMGFDFGCSEKARRLTE